MFAPTALCRSSTARFRILCFDANQDQFEHRFALWRFQCPGRGDDDRAFEALESQTAVAYRLEVATSRREDDVVARVCELRAVVSADRARADDQRPHR